MKKKLTTYGLYGEKVNPYRPNFFHCEDIETRSKPHNWFIKPHIHNNLFQILAIENGQGTFYFDDQEAPLQGPCLISIPENTVHGYTFSPGIQGRIITLSVAFIESLFKSSPSVLLTLGHVQLIQEPSDNAQFQLAMRMVFQVSEEIYGYQPERDMALQSYFSLLLIQIYRLSSKGNEKTFVVNNRNLAYFKQFQRSFKESLFSKKTIANYARDIGISTVHLNRICQSVTGKSALSIIQEHILLEAQRYLLHSSYSVSEISYLLHFDDPAYFSRLFKKHLTMSPKEFRQKADWHSTLDFHKQTE